MAIQQHKAQELIRKQQQGLGRPIISDKFRDYRVVAVGNTIHYSRKWRFFPDFLSDYIKLTLGPEWGNSELEKPFPEQHPILQWYAHYCRAQELCEKGKDGAYSADPTGAVFCYLGLAYSLYLIKHNVSLQRLLVKRLKDIRQFQGAYYELIVANCLIRAGFDLSLEDETDERSKHCEFTAISKSTGKKYWVEAKMRSVSGFLGKTDIDGSSPTSKPTSRIAAHLASALEKPAVDERLIFIDVNAPPLERFEVGSQPNRIPNWAQAAGKQLEDRERNLKPSERAYVFITNFPYHRALDAVEPGPTVLAYGLGIEDFAKRGRYRLSAVWKTRQKHADAYSILESIKEYPNIPNTFDGSIPSENAGSGNRIVIGELYFFEDIGDHGMVGEVTSATMLEDDKRMCVAVSAEDGKSYILTKEVSDSEVDDYRRHKDAYFGIVQRAPRKLRGHYDLFEWLVDSYMRTPRARLLELCKDRPDFKELEKLDHTELVLQICEGWAAAAMERMGDDAPPEAHIAIQDAAERGS